jgi:hypothetical protein
MNEEPKTTNWELWHRRNGNIIAVFGTPDDGIACVAGELAAGGPRAVLEPNCCALSQVLCRSKITLWCARRGCCS